MSIKNEIEKYVQEKCSSYTSSKLLPLMMPTFGSDEILEAFDSMVNMQITMGKKVHEFESQFSNYLGVKHSAMVNSGSSANLLALSVLSNPQVPNHIKPGDEILVPAVTWSTSIFPIINIGAIPVLIDVDEDYQIDIEKMKEEITPKTRGIVAVHLLGNVCEMDPLMEVAQDHKLFVVEDSCEAMGSEYKGKKVGTFGDFSTFSSYFSHHITTSEGGFICTNNFEYANLARILRAHGYVRDSLKKEEYISQYSDIDPRFLFVNLGYNFRATDIQAAFGLHQIKKLESFIKIRTNIGRKLAAGLSKYSQYLLLPREKPNTRHSWFVFPITLRPNCPFSKKEITDYLEKHGIETRPIVCGNFAQQPAMKLFKHRSGNLENAQSIMVNGFYIGIHPNIDDQTLSKVLNVFDTFLSKW
ncbi:MAG: DegT/DnrJ/EryC1/StrS family aminotransferase [Candidatus Bilamarchaeum sp.]